MSMCEHDSLTASENYVLEALESADDPLTRQEITDDVYYADNTVGDCLTKLRNRSLVEKVDGVDGTRWRATSDGRDR